MRVEIEKHKDIISIKVVEYALEDYNNLMGIINSFSCLYNWYEAYDEDKDETFLLNFGGWVKSEKLIEFDPFMWQWNSGKIIKRKG